MSKEKKKEQPKEKTIMTDVISEEFIDKQGNPKIRQITMNGEKKVDEKIING